MMHQAQWAEVKVGDFFRGYNWKGSSPVLESSVTEESLDNLPSLMCLSVADFFAQGSWTGQPATAPEVLPALRRPHAPPKPISVTASVVDFCRGINWKGIGLPPMVEPFSGAPVQVKEPVAKVEPAIALTDLSDLF
jgi:hypothetical protein